MLHVQPRICLLLVLALSISQYAVMITFAILLSSFTYVFYLILKGFVKILKIMSNSDILKGAQSINI